MSNAQATATCECGCGGIPNKATQSRTSRGQVRGERVRFIRGHAARPVPPPVAEDRGYGTPCLIWQGSIKPSGYGQVRRRGRTRLAHRVAYEAVHGPVPPGLDLDHLCRVRACVNSEHMEPVTRAENLRRGRIARGGSR